MGVLTMEDLKNCAAMLREAQQLRDMITALRSMLEGGVPVLDGMPHVRNTSGDRLASGMDRLMELERSYGERVCALMDHVAVVEEAIEQVDDPTQRMILRMRYIQGLTWDAISQNTIYHERWCKELHSRALEALGVCNSEQSMEMHA